MSKKLLLPAIVLLPFILFHWMLPFVTDFCFGREFTRYYTWIQMEHLFAMRTGTFPLYLHYVFGGLQSSVKAGYGQLYLPFPYVASLLPGYWTGHAIQWNALLKILTLPVAHISLFLLLRRMRLSFALSFLLTTVTVYSPRMLISFFYGSGLEAWTGHIFLCTAIGFFYLEPARKKWPLLIIGATYWLINSGHPEEMYYGMLTAAVFTLVFPDFLAALTPDARPTVKEKLFFWGKTWMWASVGILLSAAYLLPCYFDFARDISFSQQSYAEACQNTDTLTGLISNFFSPVRAHWFANFGGTSLILAAALIPLLVLRRMKIPAVIWMIFTVFLLCLLSTQGMKTPVHRILWEYLPFASSTRIPGRISLMIPMMVMLLLIWLFKQKPADVRTGGIALPPISFLSLLAICITLVYVMVPASHKLDLVPTAEFHITHTAKWVEPLSLALGLATLAMACFHGILRNSEKASGLICLTSCLFLIVVFRYSAKPVKPIEASDILTLDRLVSQKRAVMTLFPGYFLPHDKEYSRDLIPQFERYFVEPDLGKIYRKPISADSREAAYEILNRTRRQDEAVIEDFPGTPRQCSLSPGMDNAADMVELTYSSYNRMIFRAEAACPSFFVFSYAKTPHWKAWVNGRTVPIYRANAYAQAVYIPKGESTIEFRYWSSYAFWGMIISCATFALLGLAYGLNWRESRAGIFTGLTTIAAAVILFFTWFNSLYAGENLQTHYTWRSAPPGGPVNLAYGKPTAMSSISVRFPYEFNSRQAVDGGRLFPSCCLTGFQLSENPWWEVDLGHPASIGSVVVLTHFQGYEYDKILTFFYDNFKSTIYTGSVLYEGMSGYKKTPVKFNTLPLTIAVSTDYKNWRTASVTNIEKGSPMRIEIPETVEARYVRIIASGQCRLSLTEVEVYPPSPE